MQNSVEAKMRAGAGYWYIAIVGLLLVVIGVALAAGGVWLIALGGSWYYSVAGIALVVSGILLAKPSMAGVWVYVAAWLFTLVWAVWEVGLDPWPLVPRVVAPTVLLVLVLLCIPPLRRRVGPGRASGAAVAATAAVAAVGAALAGLNTTALLAQQDTEAEAAPEDEAERPPAAEPMTGTPDTDAEGGETPPAAGGETELDGEAAPALEAEDGAGLDGEGGGERQEAEEDDTAGTGETTPTGVPVRAAAETMPTGENWPAYGGTDFGTRYAPLDQINRENVGNLERVWEYRTGDMPPDDIDPAWSPETTPLKIGDDLYLCTPTNIVLAVDAATGREEWRYDPQVSYDAIPHAAACRGVAYYADPEADPQDACAERILVATLDARLIAVDAQLGEPCQDFGLNGAVSLEEGLGDTVPGWVSATSPPTVVRGIAVVGHQVNDNEDLDAPSGVVRGYDAVTGELAWAWDLGKPDLKGHPPEGETYTRGTPNMWTTAAADEELGLVYLPLGNSSVDYYGSERSEAENEYATSLVAVDVTTGEDVWHFQTVYHDVWDYDLGSQPALVDFPTPDGSIPALVLSSKQGDIYVLNRETGEPLHEVEEREVPQGGVEPDYLSPVQPFSLYHTLAFEPIKERDMWG